MLIFKLLLNFIFYLFSDNHLFGFFYKLGDLIFLFLLVLLIAIHVISLLNFEKLWIEDRHVYIVYCWQEICVPASTQIF